MIQQKYAPLFIQETVASCLLCAEPACTKACPHGIDCGALLRSLRFENYAGASARIGAASACRACTDRACERACVKGALTAPIPVQAVLTAVSASSAASPACAALVAPAPLQAAACAAEAAANTVSASAPAPVAVDNVDLSVEFLGVHCENPFFLSSSVVASNYEMIAKAFDAGWAGVAFKTIGAFVPEEVSPRFSALHKEANAFVGFKNIEQISDHTLEENLACIRRLKERYPAKVIIASIMGRTEAEWELLARKCEEAGADLLEANFSCPNMAIHGVGSDVGQSPELVAAYTAAIKRGSVLPLLAKMTPNIGNMEIPALAAVKAGADGIAAINTIKSLMNIDLDGFVSSPAVSGYSCEGGYSGKAVKPIALRFINDMKQHPQLRTVPISGMGGIETWQDAAEFMALGCGTVQVTTAVMQYGYRIVDDLIDGLKRYLARKGFSSVSALVGKALPLVVQASALDRATKQFPRFLHERCVGCGRCITSCFDGGHQALRCNEKRVPVMDGKKCVGCQLCVLVCPAKAIVAGTRTKPSKKA